MTCRLQFRIETNRAAGEQTDVASASRVMSSRPAAAPPGLASHRGTCWAPPLLLRVVTSLHTLILQCAIWRRPVSVDQCSWAVPQCVRCVPPSRSFHPRLNCMAADIRRHSSVLQWRPGASSKRLVCHFTSRGTASDPAGPFMV